MSQSKFWWNLLTKFRKRADKLYSQKKSWADSNDFWTIVKCEIGCSDRLNDVDTLEFLSSSIWIYRHCLLYRINYFEAFRTKVSKYGKYCKTLFWYPFNNGSYTIIGLVTFKHSLPCISTIWIIENSLHGDSSQFT